MGILLLGASGLLFELTIRFLLFHDSDLANRLGEDLRKPGHYTLLGSSEYWKLRQRFGLGAQPPRFDPDLGWVTKQFHSPEHIHWDEPALGGRRPVLLFGDSFARCIGGDSCWGDLLAETEHAQDAMLLNYGVNGYGTDQIAMACKLVLPRFVDRDPLVIVAILVDDDMDRAVLDFRSWPKPRFEVTPEGRLSLEERELLPDPDAYVSRYGVGIRSYGWSYLVWGTQLFPESWFRAPVKAEFARRREAVNSALLEDLRDTLRSSGVDHFVLVFHGLRLLRWRGPAMLERESFLVGELERLGIPYVLASTPLLEDMERTGRDLPVYFYTQGEAQNHYREEGNRVVFRAMLSGIEGRFDGPTQAGDSSAPGAGEADATDR